MQGASLEKGIKFYLLKAPRGAEALFVARRNVMRRLLAFFTCFGAFEDYDIAWHRTNKLVSVSLFRGRRK